LKVLIVNYRYFVSGGPERYMFNVTDLLESNGHSVVPFSITYDRNEPTPYARYFASPLSDESAVYFKDQKMGARSVMKSLERSFYSREVYRKLAALIEDEQPDVALVLHYLRKLSPSVLTCLHDHRVPFVVRLSDFGMVCANAHLFRDGGVCELCVTGSPLNGVRHRCVQGSLGASAVNYAATRFHRKAGYYDLISTFVVPSRFTIEKMVAGGFSRERLVHLPTFVSGEREPAAAGERPAEIVYVGRAEEIKGVHLLLDAIRILKERGEPTGYTVRIIGSGDTDYLDRLQSFVREHGLANVTFAGVLAEDEVRRALAGARCSVAPSLWYDNMPNAVLESLAEGTPVIAPNHGSFPEIVVHGETGLLVEPNDAGALADAIATLAGDPGRAAILGRQGSAFVAEHHSAEAHYERLMSAFATSRRR